MVWVARPSVSAISRCVAPEEVGAVADRFDRDPDVDRGSWQLGLVADREERLLEVVSGRRGPGEMVIEDGAERGVALVSVRAVEDVLDGFGVEELQQFGLVDGAFDCAAGQDGGEVEQRARDARAGDAVDLLDVAREQRPARVGVDAREPAARAPRRDDVDARSVGVSQARACRRRIDERARHRGRRRGPPPCTGRRG